MDWVGVALTLNSVPWISQQSFVTFPTNFNIFFRWILQFLPGHRENIVCRRDGTLRHSEPSAGENLSCIIPFILIYYFLVAANVWFAVFTYAWYLQTKDRGMTSLLSWWNRCFFYWSKSILNFRKHPISNRKGNQISKFLFSFHRMGSAIHPNCEHNGVKWGRRQQHHWHLFCWIWKSSYSQWSFPGAGRDFNIWFQRIFLIQRRIQFESHQTKHNKRQRNEDTQFTYSGHGNTYNVDCILHFCIFHLWELWGTQLQNLGQKFGWFYCVRYLFCQLFLVFSFIFQLFPYSFIFRCKIKESYMGDMSICKMHSRPSVAVLQLRLICLFCVNLVVSSWCWTWPTLKTWNRFIKKYVETQPFLLLLHLKYVELIQTICEIFLFFSRWI